MIWLIIPLAILGIAASATMDEIRFHWRRTFAYWFNRREGSNPNIELWFNPNYSWNNKYRWTKNKHLQWVLSSPLVFITDFWHLLKFVLLNSLYGIIILLMMEYTNVKIPWWWLLIGMNFGWGVIYEFTSSVYGRLGDKYKDLN